MKAIEKIAEFFEEYYSSFSADFHWYRTGWGKDKEEKKMKAIEKIAEFFEEYYSSFSADFH